MSKSVVRIGPSERLLCCDYCFENETVDAHDTHELRPMYRLDDDCIICHRCLDAGKQLDATDAEEEDDPNVCDCGAFKMANEE